ncbi:MAG TPA: hypothetical protein VJQ43_03865 [Thermoplasmata archaeon]|nr:hypothetical protein [Thermoplasmata archaeon]
MILFLAVALLRSGAIAEKEPERSATVGLADELDRLRRPDQPGATSR